MIRSNARLGPAMQALNPRQREFVGHMLDLGSDIGAQSRAAVLAGYSTESANSLRVTAHRLAHDKKVLAAIKEEAERRMQSGAIMAASVIMEIAATPNHKDQLKAAERLLGQSGLAVATRHEIDIKDERGTQDLLARAAVLAKSLGMDPIKLLGRFQEQLPAPIDAEFEEVSEECVHSSDGLEDLL